MADTKRLIVGRIWIDPDLCTMHTLCGPEAPGLIDHDKTTNAFAIQERELKRTQEVTL